MRHAVRITHYKVVWEAGKAGGIVVLQDDGQAQHNITVKDPAALVAILRSERNLSYEPPSARPYSGDWRSVGWIQAD